MPPAISDDEVSASEDEIPFRNKPEQNKDESADKNNEEEDEGDGGEEYVVEKILSHAFDADGICKYEVKWLGYEKKEDRTWEPESNLSGASDLLEEYFKKIGGRPKPPQKKERKRKQSIGTPSEPKGTSRGRKKIRGEDEDSGTPASAAGKKAKKTKEWEPPAGSWEDHVMSIDTVEEIPDYKTGEKVLYGYVVWNNGRKSQHPLRVINNKCPQKMLRYYEQHLVFKTGEEPNGDAEDE